MHKPFVPGMKLSERFYVDAVAPVLASSFPQLRYAAARLGNGSEVLGFDTPLSTDHDWGPRLQLFLADEDYQHARDAVHEALRQQLPKSILGYPVHFGPANDEGTRFPEPTDGPVDHLVEIWTVADYFLDYMGYDPRKLPTVYDWLVWPQQHLLGIASGKVFIDSVGELEHVRRRLAYYPHDVWLYLLAAQWQRIGQEEAFVGRAGDVGDDLGSAVIAARLVHDVMLLCFLMEKVYAPYPKWFGTAFSRLQCAATLMPLLQSVFAATDWHAREARLIEVYEQLAQQHNALGITPPLDVQGRRFYNRPYQVIGAGRFAAAIKETITDPTVSNIHTDIGSVDQFSHSTDLRDYPELHKQLRLLYN